MCTLYEVKVSDYVRMIIAAPVLTRCLIQAWTLETTLLVELLTVFMKVAYTFCASISYI